jgi:hypothetical protein
VDSPTILILAPKIGWLPFSTTVPEIELCAKVMLQKNNDKKSKYILIWLNFIDLDCQSTIIFIINKKTLKIIHNC